MLTNFILFGACSLQRVTTCSFCFEQAVGVAAFDDVGQRGNPSNIFPFVLEPKPSPIACPILEVRLHRFDFAEI